MKPTIELNNSIIEFVKSLGVLCEVSHSIVTINRTSMCNCSLCVGLGEGDCYRMILELVKEHFSDPKYWINYSGKNDDVYFLEVYIR